MEENPPQMARVSPQSQESFMNAEAFRRRAMVLGLRVTERDDEERKLQNLESSGNQALRVVISILFVEFRSSYYLSCGFRPFHMVRSYLSRGGDVHMIECSAS